MNAAGTRLDVDLGLIRKYDRPGPRYTSYPTAPHFTGEFGPADFLASLESGNDSNRPLSLYFHLPFCAKLCYFCGCTMTVTRNRDRISEYLDYLIRDTQFFARHTGNRPVTQVHWGGGTPTYLTPEETRRLGEAIQNFYNIATGAEMGVEVDPRQVSREHYQALLDTGFNRISMGVQDFHEPTQKAVNRIQPEAMTRTFVQMARDMGFESVNLDFIYGLPFQTRETFARTIDKLIDIRPDRIALFNYAHVPWMKKHQNVLKEETLPEAEEKLAIFKYAIETLTSAGYVFIGMDHFALPEDSMSRALHNKTLYRNFQGYSTHAECDLIAHGMSGISQTADTYAQNTKEYPAYFAAVAAGRPATERGYKLNSDDLLRRDVITRLMCDFELDYDFFNNKYGIDFKELFSDALADLEPMAFDGLVRLRPEGLEVTNTGRLLIRNLAMPFDRYLRASNNTRFSRTI